LELFELNAKVREKRGKGAARQLRLKKAIPAIVYGRKSEPIMLTLDVAQFDKIIRKQGFSGVFLNLKIADMEKPVMLKETQMDVFGKHYLHVDLQEIDMNTELTISIPVQAVGTSKGAKEGGLLQIIRRELNLICKPTDMPAAITIDVTDMEIGDSVHVEDIDPGENIKIPHEVNFTVLTVVAPTTEIKEEGEEEEEEIETTEETEA
jgi:large subunit ribosomal protein L25